MQRLGARRVLNCYCYTGGFSIAALAGMRAAGVVGEVVSIDSSGPALERAQAHVALNYAGTNRNWRPERAQAHVALNGFDAARAGFMDADVNASLRQFLQVIQPADDGAQLTVRHRHALPHPVLGVVGKLYGVKRPDIDPRELHRQHGGFISGIAIND